MNTAAFTCAKRTCEISFKFFTRFFFSVFIIQRLLSRDYLITIAIENLYRTKWITMEACVCGSCRCRCHIRHLLHCAPPHVHSIAISYISFYDHVMFIASSSWHRDDDHSFSIAALLRAQCSIQCLCLVSSDRFSAWRDFFFMYFNPLVFKWSDYFLIARYSYYHKCRRTSHMLDRTATTHLTSFHFNRFPI